MMRDLPRAGEPMSSADLVSLLGAAHDSVTSVERDLYGDRVVFAVVTSGPDRVGRSLAFVRGTDDTLGVLDRLGESLPDGFELHALHAGDLVTVSAVDRGAVTVRHLVWTSVGAAGLVVGWSAFLADLISRVTAFGGGL